MSNGLPSLSRRLGYEFKKQELLERALTHSSKSAVNNEQLEFLGDSVLNFVISAALYERHPEVAEGELTRMRAGLVKKPTLARLARAFELGSFLRLGSGELRSGGFTRESILADALEALFGAVFLDGGIEQARAVIERVYVQALNEISPATAEKDAKTRLQEYLQRAALATPTYTVIEVSGEAHDQSFRVQCAVPGLAQPVEGNGKTRRGAEQEAAARALRLLVGADGG